MNFFQGFFILLIISIIALVINTFIDRTMNKDFYTKCSEDFKSNPYSFDKTRLNDCNYLFWHESANLTTTEAVKKAINKLNK